MKTQLQTLIDKLAERLERTVTVDDRYWNLEAYSAAHEEPDPLRLDALLHRGVPTTARKWVHELRLAEATAPVRTPANAGIGADPRIVFPIRYGDVHLGFLTLLDRANDLDEESLATIGSTAERAAEILYRDHLSQNTQRNRERELLRQLLSEDARRRQQAAAALRDEDLLAPFEVAAIAVAQLVEVAAGPEARPDQRQSLDRGLEWVRRRAIPGTTVGVVNADHAIVLVSGDNVNQLLRVARELLLGTTANGPDRSATVGLSAPVEEITALPGAVDQAATAAMVAARVPRFAGLASWDDLGVYRMLARFADDDEMPSHPAFERLRAADRGGILVETLEAYLDLAGDVKETAKALSLHRSGLYYRLARIAELAEVDLTDGETRLGLHLAIKLEQVSGSGSAG